MTWQQLQDIPVAIYQAGAWFGEFEVHKNMQRLFSCLAKADTELFALDKKQFKQIFFKSFPHFGRDFVRQMDRDFENLENTMQSVIDYVYPETVDAQIEKQFEFIRAQAKVMAELGRVDSPVQSGTLMAAGFNGLTGTRRRAGLGSDSGSGRLCSEAQPMSSVKLLSKNDSFAQPETTSVVNTEPNEFRPDSVHTGGTAPLRGKCRSDSDCQKVSEKPSQGGTKIYEICVIDENNQTDKPSEFSRSNRNQPKFSAYDFSDFVHRI